MHACTGVNKAPVYELTHCIACGGKDSREVADADSVRRELEALWAFHGRRLLPTTPPSRLADRVAFSEPPPFRLVSCTRCRLVYRNPIERARALAAIYTGTAPPDDVLRALHERQSPASRAQVARLLRLLATPRAVLEVGSYVGAFLGAAREAFARVEGLDINAGVNRFTRSLGFAVHDGDLASFDTDRRYDAVAIWNTFDQLADPCATAHRAWRLLRPGGVLAVRVPNGAFYTALRRAADRGAAAALARLALAHNNLLTFPYRYGFTVRALAALLARVGFAVRAVVGDVLVPVADEWTRPWARAEERAVKLTLGVVARTKPEWAPWIEVYATR